MKFLPIMAQWPFSRVILPNCRRQSRLQRLINECLCAAWVENLESRNMLASNITAALSKGILTVTGSSAADHVTIEPGTQAGSVRFIIDGGTVNGQTSLELTGLTKDLRVALAGGDDLLVIRGFNSAKALPKNVTINTGEGADTVELNQLVIRGATKLVLEAGDDTLRLDDSQFEKKSAFDTGGGADNVLIERRGEFPGITTFGKKLTLDLGDDNDVVRAGVDGDAAQRVTASAASIDGGAGQDNVSISANSQFPAKLTLVENRATVPLPQLTVQLSHDSAPSGTTNSDGITNNASLSGTVSPVATGYVLSGGLDETPVAEYVDLTEFLQANGTFAISHETLISLFEESLTDGPHTFHLQATDPFGDVSEVVSLNFTLDTNGPTVGGLELASASDSGIKGDRVTSQAQVTIQGVASPFASLTLLATGQTVTAGADGTFQFVSVPLTLGDNALTVTGMDAAGNTSTPATITIHRIEPDTTLPLLELTDPVADGFGFQLTQYVLTFSEPIDAGRLNIDGVTLTNLGADSVPGGDDDAPVSISGIEAVGDNQVRILFTGALPDGRFQLSLAADMIADREGNLLQNPVSRTFTNYNVPAEGTVVWINSAGGDWNNPANWSTGQVPSATDIIIIDLKTASPTIAINSGEIFIKQLRSSEHLTIGAASLLVTGTMTVTGGIDFTGGATVQADGAAASVIVTGSTTARDMNLFAKNGGRIQMTNLTAYDAGQGFVDTKTFEARGVGSSIELPNLATLLGRTSLGCSQAIRALDGGHINLSGLQSISQGATDVFADGSTSTIDLSTLTSFSNGSLGVAHSGTISCPLLKSLNHVALSLGGELTGTIDTDQIESIIYGAINVVGITLELPHATTVNGSHLLVSAGGVLRLPLVTSYDGLPGFVDTVRLEASGAGSVLDLSAVTTFFGHSGQSCVSGITALNGGRVDLSSVTKIEQGRTAIFADGATSVVDLESLTSLTSGDLSVARSGKVNSPALTTLSGVGLVLTGGGTIHTAQMQSITGSAIYVTGVTPDLSSVTNIDRSSLYVSAGGVLQLLQVTSYHGELGFVDYLTLEARGENSVLDLSNIHEFGGRYGLGSGQVVQAVQGGFVNLKNTNSFTDGTTNIIANGANSIVDIGLITGADHYTIDRIAGGDVI